MQSVQLPKFHPWQLAPWKKTFSASLQTFWVGIHTNITKSLHPLTTSMLKVKPCLFVSNLSHSKTKEDDLTFNEVISFVLNSVYVRKSSYILHIICIHILKLRSRFIYKTHPNKQTVIMCVP